MVRHKDPPSSVKPEMLVRNDEDSDLMRSYYQGNKHFIESFKLLLRDLSAFLEKKNSEHYDIIKVLGSMFSWLMLHTKKLLN